jgi:hypothetical protein
MAEFNQRTPAHSFRVLVFNIGARYHNNYARYEATLNAWASHLRRTFSGLKVWREYAPTHFDSLDGTYESIPSNQSAPKCRPLNLSESSCHQCREPYNRIAEAVLGTEFLRLRIHALSLERWDAHRGASDLPTFHNARVTDCRHWQNMLKQPHRKRFMNSSENEAIGGNQTLVSSAFEDSSVLEHWNLLLGHLLQARLTPPSASPNSTPAP